MPLQALLQRHLLTYCIDMNLHVIQLKLYGFSERREIVSYNLLDLKLPPCVECRIVFLCNLLASELLVPTFRNFLSVPSS